VVDKEKAMDQDNAPFQIHVHGDIVLRHDVGFDALEAALKPLWKYTGARSLAGGAESFYDSEPGIQFDPQEHVLHICWTLEGDEDFRYQLDEMCMNLNEVSASGAAIEVTFYDASFDEEDEEAGGQSRDDFMILYVGPTPEAIMTAQRDSLVEDMVRLMQRHFDESELTGVIAEVDKLFAGRFHALVDSLRLDRAFGSVGGVSARHQKRRPDRLH